jgi:quercetin dioxygenase-like cupin family protein
MMKVVKPLDLPPEPVEFNGAIIPGVTIRWLIKKDDGARNFAMRYFEIDKNAVIPEHKHPWEHEIFILQGKVKVTVNGDEKIVEGGSALYIEPDAPHAYENTGDQTLVMLCLIPYTKV